MLYNANQKEQEILKYWDEHDCFNKSVEQRPEDKPYVFYDGPPFATGLPHYGHILSSVIKDVVPRYWTMKGYKVRRRWGWDCHGLPIESLIEKELKTSGKKEIEEKLGVEKFNEACRSRVLMYTKEWKKMVDRIGRWIEFDNAYKTMDSTYMESVWWALKTIWNKGLIYEGRKVLMYCPRCETPVSKAEIAMDDSYKDITEEAVTVKFKVKYPKRHDLPENTYILAWTTTPWTLPGNVALAVGPGVNYCLMYVEEGEHKRPINGKDDWVSDSYYCVVAKERVETVMKDKEYRIEKEFTGSDLIGIEYKPLFDVTAVRATGKKVWYITSADFVTTEEGTGVVHTAVIYGEDDYNLGLKIDLPMVPLLDDKGIFNDSAPGLIRGLYFKDSEAEIKDNLENHNLLFTREQYTHSYPHCWRCDTQLFYNAISAWFIDIQKIKSRLIELNEEINWFPEHLKHGRFLNILETAPDWNISRNRYWATPLPFWKCTNNSCNNTECVGSASELKEKAVNFVEVFNIDEIEKIDLHKHNMDKIKLRCQKCNGEMKRTPEVIDCWVESASMPFAEWHYPFENKKVFEKRFPGQYIAEYIAQTRAWFYYMHVMAVLLFDNISFENCITTGTILNEKGEKLSKSKMNYTDPWVIIEQYGVDALRYYLMTSVVMQADNLLFNDREVKDIYGKVINMLWNVFEFYQIYETDIKVDVKQTDNVLDKWILAKTQQLIKEVTESMDNYDTVRASRPIKEFIGDLSQWYVRRSRNRFKIPASATAFVKTSAVKKAMAGKGEVQDKQAAMATLRQVLLILSKVMAPFTPFIAEKIYLEVGGNKESVHLEEWPKVDDSLVNEEILTNMVLARKVVEMGLSLRADNGVKVKQPLAKLAVNNKLADDLKKIIAEELNVKEVQTGEIGGDKLAFKEEGELKVYLDLAITEELKKEGLVREIIRAVNQIRKDRKLTIDKKVVVEYSTGDELLRSVFEEYVDELKKHTAAGEFQSGRGDKEVKIGEQSVKLSVIEEV